MRRIITLGITVALLATPSTVSAHHRAVNYCSPTGDICQSTATVDGARMLRISLAAEYFTRYRICVTAPDDSKVCRDFRVHEVAGGVFRSSVRWTRHFPRKGPGPYVVVWRSLPGEARVGHILGFHVR